jgi:hypothetical protein
MGLRKRERRWVREVEQEYTRYCVYKFSEVASSSDNDVDRYVIINLVDFIFTHDGNHNHDTGVLVEYIGLFLRTVVY